MLRTVFDWAQNQVQGVNVCCYLAILKASTRAELPIKYSLSIARPLPFGMHELPQTNCVHICDQLVSVFSVLFYRKAMQLILVFLTLKFTLPRVPNGIQGVKIAQT